MSSRHLSSVGLITLLLFFVSTPALAKPPVVVKAVPDNGEVGVDPGLDEIRVKFDQPMRVGQHYSVVGGGESFPKITGEPQWSGDRTIVLKVKLQPNHAYQLSINSEQFQNFKNRSGQSATPYPIKFRTGPDSSDKPGEASSKHSAAVPLTPQQNKRAVNLLLTSIRDHYSYRDRLGIDWKQQISQQRSALVATTSANDFADRAAELLAKAEDKHLWLKVEGKLVPTYVRPVAPNVNFEQLTQLVPGWQIRGRGVASGQWDDGIGYLFIETWDRSKAKGLMTIFDVLWEMHDVPALVIDVRGNGGGDEKIAQAVAGCFADAPAVYAKHVYCDPDNPGEFSKPQERVLYPNKRRPRYRGQIAVLTGPVVMSSSEAFLLMMKQVPKAVLIGSPSQGSSGNPKPHDLGNGVTVFVPSWKAMTPDGKPFEGLGILPDYDVPTEPDGFSDGDPVLDEALKYLRGKIGR